MRRRPARSAADRDLLAACIRHGVTSVIARPSQFPQAEAADWTHEHRAGLPAEASDLIDIDELINAYYDRKPDAARPRAARRLRHERPPRIVAVARASTRTTSSRPPRRSSTTATARASPGRCSSAATRTGCRCRPSAARSRCSSRTASTCASTRATRGCRPRRSATRSSRTTAAGRSMTRAARTASSSRPSHNPPRDGGFKYNPPNGGPADTDATGWIADRANELIAARPRGRRSAPRSRTSTATRSASTTSATRTSATSRTSSTSTRSRSAGVRIGADPLGGASVEYWALIAELLRPRPHGREPRRRPDLAVHDARLGREDPHGSVVAVRHGLARRATRHDYDILTGNDADADRHGIVTPDAGLMNPNHYLAVAIDYLYAHRPGWPADAAIGKTLVSSMIIDRVAESLGRTLLEVPVGFKWFVPGPARRLGRVRRRGVGRSIVPAHSTARSGRPTRTASCCACSPPRSSPSPARRRRSGTPSSRPSSGHRPTSASTPRRRRRRRRSSAKLSPGCRDARPNSPASRSPPSCRTRRATARRSAGSRCVTEHAWFAARPSGTEDVYKLYAESLRGPEHLREVQEEARAVVAAALGDA